MEGYEATRKCWITFHHELPRSFVGYSVDQLQNDERLI